jgi:dTDP-4-amino-4,6-dideoxygalactose transaminase
MNSRLDEVQAAVLRVKLRHLDRFTAERRAIAARYDDALGGLGIELPARRADDGHVFHLYVVRTNGRDRLLEFLRAREIGAALHYPQPVHLQPAYLGRLSGSGDLPETERAAGEILSLPMYPELSEADQQRVIDAVVEWTGQ